jgi:hypothetical protein
MNVNHGLKTIWWAPERCGTKATANIFSKLGFEFYYNLETYRQNIKTPYQSHQIEVPEELSEYKIIFSSRNPYDRILSLFCNFTSVGRNISPTKESESNFILRFEIFLKEVFLNLNNKDDRDRPLFNNYISKYTFDTKTPDTIIRMESMIEDLSKIDFIKNSDLWKSGYIHDYISDNEYIVRRPFKFNKVYTKAGAKLVYEYFTKHFILCGYDPFSFTTETLTNEEKMDFIHGNLQ